MEMTNNDCMVMLAGLKRIKQPAFADIKDMEEKEKYIFHVNFVKAISFNKRKLEPIIESLQEADKSSEDYEKYTKERNEVLAKYSKKDDEGNPLEIVQYLDGQPTRALNVPTAAVPGSSCFKELKKLEDDNKEIISARKKQTEDVKKMLKETAEFTPMMIEESMVPDGLQPEAMDGVIFMVNWKETTVEEEKKAVKKK